MSKAALAVVEAVSEMDGSKPVTKPVNPKTGKGGKTVTKGLKPVPTNGHKQVHIKQDIEKAGVLKALQMVLGAPGTLTLTDDERAGAQRVLDRLEART